MDYSPDTSGRREPAPPITPYPFPVPALSLSPSLLKTISSEWLREEVPYVLNILALVEGVLTNKSGDHRLNLLQADSVRPLLPTKGEFPHPTQMTNGRAFEDHISLNPWRVWDLFGSAITSLHELEHRSNQDFAFADRPAEIARREIRAHKQSVIDAECLQEILSNIPAPSDALRAIWTGAVAVRRSSHALQAVTYQVLHDVQLVLRHRVEAIETCNPDVRARLIGKFSGGTLTAPFQTLRNLWGAGDGTIPSISLSIEALVTDPDIGRLLDRSEPDHWRELGSAHQRAALEFSTLAAANTESVIRFGPTKVVPPRRIGPYFN